MSLKVFNAIPYVGPRAAIVGFCQRGFVRLGHGGGHGGGQAGIGGGGLTEQELVRKMEEVTIGQVRRIEVRGSRALFTPQVLPRFH